MITFSPAQQVHIIGIGGFGMSAIARILLGRGLRVSGSDRSLNALTAALARDGATIYEGHDASHVNGADMVLMTSAVPADHIEVLAALSQNIPVYKRSDIMAALMSGQQTIAIAGTHGKTTTTAMTTHILRETGRDPSYIIGGVLRTTGQNAGVGHGAAFVVEADEYDNMFHGLQPEVAVVTNIEWDHPDFFPSPTDLNRAFAQFIRLLPLHGVLIACADDPYAMMFASNRIAMQKPAVTYGVENPQADWRAVNVRAENGGMTFEVVGHGMVRLLLPGTHNVLNAMAAMIAADHQGVPFPEAAAALATFEGTGRRFEVRADVEGVVVIDDYAHHPTAIRVTLEAARARYPDRTLWAVWQPHTYSRTRALLEDYAAAFDNADYVLVTDIFASREAPIRSVNSPAVIAAIQRHSPALDARHVATLADTAALLDAEVHAPAVILIMSAGDAPQVGIEFLKRRGQP
jgi:UDP-N-acetylmuramate--alanine ligase